MSFLATVTHTKENPMIKAVVVGVNAYKLYPDQNLAGCLNDAEDLVGYLTQKRGVATNDITVLLDQQATKSAIVTAIRDMIASSSAGDQLLLHFSGHGTQVASFDVNEPDVLDEVLCPHDFNFSDRSTALTDNEISALIGALPANVAWTLLVDACHSGDLTKDLSSSGTKARFLRPPLDVKLRTFDQRMRVRRRSFSTFGLSVSACTSSEKAIDTSFEGRANGAFTYNWLDALEAKPDAPIDALVKTVGTAVESYNMHPEAQGPAELRSAAFLAGATIKRAAPLSAGMTRSPVLFDGHWNTSIVGLPVSFELRVKRGGGTFVFELTPGVAGSKFNVTLPVSGNMSIPIPLTMIGQLVVDLRNWSVSPTQLDFDLTARIVPSLPFIPSVTFARERISVPLRLDERSFAPAQSAADLHAMIELVQRSLAPEHRPTTAQATNRAITAQDNTPFASLCGKLDWGPNWREDRAVTHLRLPHNQVRYGEPIFINQRGAGNVYFVRWVNDDPTDGSFVVHIGNSFFGGWGSIEYQVQAVYANIDIVFRELEQGPAKRTTTPHALPTQQLPVHQEEKATNGVRAAPLSTPSI